MHCPSCGTNTKIEQRFCRSCGMDLVAVNKLVAQHSSPEGLQHEKSLAEKSALLRLVRSFGWGMGSFIFGMALLFVLKTLEIDKTYNLAAAFFLFLGMALMVYGVLSGMRSGALNSRKLPKSAPPELAKTEATKELPAAREPVLGISVTERTTQLIGKPGVGNQREDEG